ncbi:MAG TPA: GNAT family N-acetyltransferase [Vicinamibacterales bacterium]|jgi:ribosomal-protein-alanine N-acetyltransferase
MVHVVDDSGWRCALPPLEGENVRLRELRASDAGALLELLTEPSVAAHISAPPPSMDAFEGFIAWTHRERSTGESVCYGIVPKGLCDAVGLIQVRRLDPSFFVAEWGFAIGAAFWGTGIFTEAAVLAAHFAFEVLEVHRLEARAVSHNGRGNGALQKIGAKTEGVLAKAFKTTDGYLEQLLWALTAEDLAERPCDRFCTEAAKARVAQAIADTREMFAQRPPRPAIGRRHMYPFFVSATPRGGTCGRCGAPAHHGRCAS